MNIFVKRALLFAVCLGSTQQVHPVSEDDVATYGCAAGIAAGLISGIAIANITQNWSPPARYAALFIGCSGACALTNITVSAAYAELTPYGRLSRAHHAIHELEHDEIMKQLHDAHKHIRPNKALWQHLSKLHETALKARKNLVHAHEEATNKKYPHGIARHCIQLIEHLDVIIAKMVQYMRNFNYWKNFYERYHQGH